MMSENFRNVLSLLSLFLEEGRQLETVRDFAFMHCVMVKMSQILLGLFPHCKMGVYGLRIQFVLLLEELANACQALAAVHGK